MVPQKSSKFLPGGGGRAYCRPLNESEGCARGSKRVPAAIISLKVSLLWDAATQSEVEEPEDNGDLAAFIPTPSEMAKFP